MPEFRHPGGLGQTLYRALTGMSPRSEGRTAQERTQDLVKRHGGSTRRAAETLGVSQRTVQRRMKGTQGTTRQGAERLAQAQRAARMTSGRAQNFTGSATATSTGPGTGGLSIFATVRVSEDERTRWINPGKNLPEGSLDHIVDTMREQGPDAAAQEFQGVISSSYLRGMTIDSIEAIEYD